MLTKPSTIEEDIYPNNHGEFLCNQNHPAQVTNARTRPPQDFRDIAIITVLVLVSLIASNMTQSHLPNVIGAVGVLYAVVTKSRKRSSKKER